MVIPSPATSYNYHLVRVHPTPGTDGEQRKVNKQQQTALNMARFIKSQSL
ncbi:Rop family plasmid primer RNA-binding protein, partial [Escherichia coli]|nr:Rop family plasmid primer RNA-binding protein [Escherichia coli]